MTARVLNTRSQGAIAEDLACEYLLKHGYKILQRNYAFVGNFKGGEIDIIAKHGEAIHFIEVKSRTNDAFGLGREAVGTAKQRTIRKLAIHYLVAHKLYDRASVSFDVIEITCDKVEHLINCF
ncbi:MAG: YraN family protein [Christensenellaceae bacterium]|jgi:putative endonuclease|nr:YraN family protein [Christensenellaceae bacterium]